jgi:hypothetical protein
VRIQSGGNWVFRRRRQGEIAVNHRVRRRSEASPPDGKKYRIRSKHRHCCSAKRSGQRIGGRQQSLVQQAVRNAQGPVRGSAQTRRRRKISPSHMARGGSLVRRSLGTKGGFVADSRCAAADQVKAGPACRFDAIRARHRPGAESDSHFQPRGGPSRLILYDLWKVSSAGMAGKTLPSV